MAKWLLITVGKLYRDKRAFRWDELPDGLRIESSHIFNCQLPIYEES